MDFTHNPIVFPEFICSSDQRPDIIIFSKQSHHVILVELTCPAEENIIAAQVRKTARYLDLQELISSSTSWTCTLLTIEAGARGFVAKSMHAFLRKTGFTPRQASSACKSISLIVAKCSHTIWLSHKNPHWAKKDLLVLDCAIEGSKPTAPGDGAF